MTIRLTDGMRECELRAGAGSHAFLDEADAEAFLRPFAADPENLVRLRQTLEDVDHTKLSNEQLIRAVAVRLVRGELGIAPSECETIVPPIEVGKAEAPAAPAERAPKTWIAFHVVDDSTDDPIPDVRLRVTLPDGQEKDAATDGEGKVEFKEFAEGTCAVSSPIQGAVWDRTYRFVGTERAAGEVAPSEGTAWCECEFCRTTDPLLPEEPAVEDGSREKEPRWVALVEDHRADSIDTLARENDLKRDDLTHFNGEASTEDPTALLVPKKWTASDLSTGRTHVFRVRPVLKKEHHIAVRLLAEDGVPIAGKACLLEEEGATITTDAEGLLRYAPVSLQYQPLQVDGETYFVPAIPRDADEIYRLHLPAPEKAHAEVAGDLERILAELGEEDDTFPWSAPA